MNEKQLERYSFLWSEARLVLAAIALFLGGIPLLAKIMPVTLVGGYSLLYAVLQLSWIMSGAASAYLLYQWVHNGQRVFGGQELYDKVAFFVSVISGLNLGVTGVSKNNIGMSIASNQIVFILTAIIYLASAWYLYKRWKESGEKVF